MTRTCCLVVNPAAGGGRSKRLLPLVTAVLDATGTRHEVRASTSLEHAKELAVAAAGRGDVVVAFGGDGMVGALAGAVAAVDGVFGIIPSGRGNDFVRTLGLPFSPADAARVLVHGQERQVDLIGVRHPEAAQSRAAGPAELVVAGSVYLGIPAAAAEIAGRTKWLAGPLVYPAAGIRAVVNWKSATFRVELERGGATTVKEFSGGAVVVANSRYFGGGMMVAPDADTSDGLLDVIFIRDASKLDLIRALAKIKNGSHVTMSQIGMERAVEVTVTSGRPVPCGADGEALPSVSPLPAGSQLRIRALPGALRVLVPPLS
jgi:YegS/Rv2252/BmrU family lipid kinase